LQEFLQKSRHEEGFKSFNKNKKEAAGGTQCSCTKKEWFALSKFYQKVKYPSLFDCQLLASVLGNHWSTTRIQNWFQHERQRKKPSKFADTKDEPEDNQLWNQFLQV